MIGGVGSIDRSVKSLIRSGVEQLSYQLCEENISSILEYLNLISRFNLPLRLTNVRKPGYMISRHILESLVVAPYIKGSQILDVGTGVGIPGIPLAIALPGRQFTLLDKSEKKTQFLNQAITALGIKNVEVVNAPLEEFKTSTKMTTVIARAWSDMDYLITGTSQFLKEKGQIFFMRGIYPKAELVKIKTKPEVIALSLPGFFDERYLICFNSINSYGG